jgi:glycosyltransferase involved in cell wall biosynthesis
VAKDVDRLLGVKTITVVGEGVDHLRRYSPPENDQERDTLTILAGRAPHKRADLGCSAALLALTGIGCKVAVIGETQRLRLPPSVQQLRNPTDEQLGRLYSRTRLLIAPSKYEGFGLAVGEALWFGIPVVYALDSPLRDLVRGGGVGARPTAESFAEATAMSWSKFPQLSRQARKSVEHLTWEKTAELVVHEIENSLDARVAIHPSSWRR